MRCRSREVRGAIRAGEWAKTWSADAGGLDEEWSSAARDAFGRPLVAAAVLGRLVSVAVSRLQRQFDLGGPGFAISAEHLSGLHALRLACRALTLGELDAALVAAVGSVLQPAHEASVPGRLLPEQQTPGDAGVVLVLKRAEDARRDGDAVLAVLTDGTDTEREPDLLLNGADISSLFGHSVAAEGLLAVAAAALACAHRALPGQDDVRPWLPSGPSRRARVTLPGTPAFM